MSHHSELLRQAVDSIAHTFKKRTITSLLSGRRGVLLEADKQVSAMTDFTLVTWLVMKAP
jgi:hypothetical protein